MLLLTWHESSETTKELVCYSVTPSSLPQHDPKLDGEAGFADVSGSGVRQFKFETTIRARLSLRKPNFVSYSRTHLSEVSTQEPIMAEVSTQEPIVAEVSTEAPIVEEVGTQEFKDQYSTDDDDVDEDFLVDEENEIVKPDVDVHLFGITIDLPFDNIGITNLVPDDVLKGEDVDVINADGFDSNPSNDEERNYKKRRLAELRTEMEGVINASEADIVSGKEQDGWKEKSAMVNPDILVKAVQDQLQRELECVSENRLVWRALKLGFRACRRDLLGLDGAFTKGPFPGQVLVADGLDLNNEIYPLAYALVEAKSRAKTEFIAQQPALRIMESIKKEAYLMKVQWNGANKYQVSGLLRDHLLEYGSERLGGTTPRNLGKSLLLVEYMEGNILSQDTTNLWDQLLVEVHMSNNTFATQASCPGKEEPIHVNHAETLDTIRQHAKDKVERQQQVVISALSCGNNAEADGSASRQAQQTELAVGQDGLGGSGAGAILGLSAAGEGAAGGLGGVGVARQGSSRTIWTKRRVQTQRISPQKTTPTQPASQPFTSSQVLVSQTRNADGREIGDGVPTQSSAAGGVSEWSFL
ncbi:hypothetical protein Tco_1133287 [Tanacetum coccineum]